jgi:hypothetical protein
VLDYNAYTVIVTYNTGRVEEIPLTEELLVEADVLKLYREGTHDVSITYGGATHTFKVTVKRGTFGELSFPENTVFVYDGKEHSVEVQGDVPANATVTYPEGNIFVNAGTYDVRAVVTCEGYVTKTLSTTVRVERASYDMSGIRFASKEVVYNGKPQTITVSGTLPEGVSEPTYYVDGNKTSSAVDAGTYTVKVTFETQNPNYNVIPAMEATLKILPAQLDLSAVDLVFKNEDGSIIEEGKREYDGSTVIFDINDRELLAGKAGVAFSVFNEKGEEISNSPVTTGIADAGVYTVKTELLLLDNKNYLPIDPFIRTFEVTKINYDTSDFHFDSGVATYRGEMNMLTATVPELHDIKASDITYEYYRDGVRLESNGLPVNGVSEAGEYTVKARFNVTNANYNPIPDMEATLKIEKAIIALDGYSFNSLTTVLPYTGSAQTVVFQGEETALVKIETSYFKIEGETRTKVAEAIEIGSYVCVATVSVKSDNYALVNGADRIEYRCGFEIVSVDA